MNENRRSFSETDMARRLEPVKYFLFAAFAVSMLIYLAKPAPARQAKNHREQVRLGERLFNDERFSSPKGDMVSSCSHCHLYETDSNMARAFTDSFARSWIPWRSEDPRREGARNAPTLFDLVHLSRLHSDGEFESLEELVRGTLSGRPFGWLPGEEAEAFQQIYSVVMNDKAGPGSYNEQFMRAFEVAPGRLDRNEVVDLVSRAISDYMRTIKSARTSPYDKFVEANGLETGPKHGEGPDAFAGRVLDRVSSLERRGKLRAPAGFGREALAGMKIFFRTEGPAAAGNCVSCHAPPFFTDSSFHNIGITQSEYDQVHGEGSFAALKIPEASEAARPSMNFREAASRQRPDNVDLGYWNNVKLGRSPLRREGEGEDQFLRRMIGAFKTPTLRNLVYSQPYMHNGGYPSLASVLDELLRQSELARSGRVREADEGLARIRIAEADIRPLIAFLNALNEDLKPRTSVD
ncbi:MAG TPA: cytochrome c peroxidase [Blastocatellia bacterium]|jgi:cytochrome c peroxidase|nr:cytochrome c peroxidase [Blastocatellia bacterium]